MAVTEAAATRPQSSSARILGFAFFGLCLALVVIAYAVRSLFGGRNLLWLQFAFPAAGVFWFVLHWREHRRRWLWIEQMPVLVSASLLTTGYGWLFDQTLLVVPIVALAGRHANKLGRLPRNLVMQYTALNVILILLAMASTPWSFVPAPLVIAFLLYREARAGDKLSPYGYLGARS